MTDCPCGSGQGYDQCCAKIHATGAGLGATAESLMRARYSAYALGQADFLMTSWHPDFAPPAMAPFPEDQEWLGLEIVRCTGGSAFDSEATVEFRARFTRGDEFFELHERSSFMRVGGRWLYVDGVEPAQNDTGDKT